MTDHCVASRRYPARHVGGIGRLGEPSMDRTVPGLVMRFRPIWVGLAAQPSKTLIIGRLVRSQEHPVHWDHGPPAIRPTLREPQCPLRAARRQIASATLRPTRCGCALEMRSFGHHRVEISRIDRRSTAITGEGWCPAASGWPRGSGAFASRTPARGVSPTTPLTVSPPAARGKLQNHVGISSPDRWLMACPPRSSDRLRWAPPANERCWDPPFAPDAPARAQLTQGERA